MKPPAVTSKEPTDRFALETYGVRVGVRCDRADVLQDVRNGLLSVLPEGKYREIPYSMSRERFIIGKNKEHEYVFYRGRRKISATGNRLHFLRYLESMVRITIAEKAKDVVFVHAGVIAWNGVAIVIPARSHAGKTTLVAELVRLGAEYYSDEYAVLDAEGFVHPYLKPLSMRRPGENEQTDTSVEEIGGIEGRERRSVGLVLVTSFEQDARWDPVRLTAGMGVIEMLPHAIPASFNPEFTLNVLNKIANRAIILKIIRGEASDFAPKLLNYLENTVLKHVIIA